MMAISAALTSRRKTIAPLVAFDSAFSRFGCSTTTSAIQASVAQNHDTHHTQPHANRAPAGPLSVLAVLLMAAAVPAQAKLTATSTLVTTAGKTRLSVKLR